MEKKERKCSLNAMKSVSRTMSTRERAAAPSKPNKARGRLDKPRLLIHVLVQRSWRCAMGALSVIEGLGTRLANTYT